MTVLILASEPEKLDEHEMRSLVEHLFHRWPGTFFLGLMPRLPHGLELGEQFDWMSWPLTTLRQPRFDDAALLRKLMRRFDVQAVLGLGAGSRQLLTQLGGGLLVCFEKLDQQAKQTQDLYVLDFHAVSFAESFDALDSWLAQRIAVDMLVSSGYDWDELLAKLQDHAAANNARHLRVRWVGKASADLVRLLERLCDHHMFEGAHIELELLSSELFRIRRSGLTHSPADFLLKPDAWRQTVAFANLLLTAPPRVKITVRTFSSKAWIRKSVDLANTASGSIRARLATVWR